MGYQTNAAEVAYAEAEAMVAKVTRCCTPDLCPTFHVYGGDCGHALHVEAIVEGYDYNWLDASAMVRARHDAFNPGHQDAHVSTWRNDDDIPF